MGLPQAQLLPSSRGASQAHTKSQPRTRRACRDASLQAPRSVGKRKGLGFAGLHNFLSPNLNHGLDFLSLFARSILFKAEPPEKREIGGEIQVPFVVSSTPLLHVTLRVELLNTTRARISDPVQMSSKSCAPWGFAVASPGFTTYSLSFSTFLRDRNKAVSPRVKRHSRFVVSSSTCARNASFFGKTPLWAGFLGA